MVSFDSVKAASGYTLSGLVIGAFAFPVLDYLDGNALSYRPALIGAAGGAILGTGIGMLINARKDNRVEDYMVAAPLLGAGTTMSVLKLHPRTRSWNNKQLISGGLVGGMAGLAVGYTIDKAT